jgi:hypothetical protein
MAGCLLHAPFFENIGNMIICDDNIRAGGTALTFTQFKMEKATLSSFDNTYKIAAHPRSSSVGTVYGMEIDLTLTVMTSITQAYFNFAGSGGVNGGTTISGDIEGMFTQAASAGQQSLPLPSSRPTRSSSSTSSTIPAPPGSGKVGFSTSMERSPRATT